MAAQQPAHELEKMALNHIQNTREGKLDSKFSNKSSLCGKKGGRVSLLCAFLLGALCHTIIYLSTEEEKIHKERHFSVVLLFQTTTVNFTNRPQPPLPK